MEVDMFIQAIRHTLLFVALAALPGFAAAAGSQAGDNGRLPIGADNEGPRQAIPNAMTNDGNLFYYYDGPAYNGAPRYVQRYDVPPTYYVPPYYGVPPYFGPTYDQWDVSFCDRQPLAERAACRDAAVAAYDYRYYPQYRYYPEYRYYYYPGDTSTRNTNTTNRCLALSGAARLDCLKGAAPGG
jgi:hypothetical protein